MAVEEKQTYWVRSDEVVVFDWLNEMTDSQQGADFEEGEYVPWSGLKPETSITKFNTQQKTLFT